MSELEREMSVAEFVADRMKKDPKIQRIVADAHIFDDLRQSPGWKRLYEKVVVDKQRVTNDVARRLMAGGTVSSEEIAYYRGFYQGAVYVLEHPAQAERSLERAASVAWGLVQAELVKTEEEQSPYITG